VDSVEVRERVHHGWGMGEVTVTVRVGSEALKGCESSREPLVLEVDPRVLATCASRRWFEVVAGARR
jgi:hypothetical protein